LIEVMGMALSKDAQKDMFNRLRRIEGQARGVQRMLNEERDCLEILTQLASLRSAAYGASVVLAEHYALQCLHDADRQQSPDEAVRSLVGVLLRSPHA
jgi:DNA-binding FrmR family transcriptional regulator